MIDVQAETLRTILAENLRARRMQLRLTQIALAKRLEVTQPYIVALEKGKYGLGLDQLARVAEALETSPAALLTADIFSTPAA